MILDLKKMTVEELNLGYDLKDQFNSNRNQYKVSQDTKKVLFLAMEIN